MAKVKGILFTLGGVFIAGLIITLAIFTANAMRFSATRTAEVAALDRTYNLQKSIERTIRKIDTGINITIENSEISISENLGNNFNSYSQPTKEEFTKLRNHLLEYYPEITLDINGFINSEQAIPIIIRPYNIIYTHKNEADKVKLEIQPTVLIDNLEIKVHLNDETIDHVKNVEWIIQNLGSSVNLNLTGSDYTSYQTSISESINPKKQNIFKIGSAYIIIGRICEGCIEVYSTSANIDTFFKSELPEIGNMITANYENNLIKIHLSDIGITMNNYIRIA